MKRTLSILLAVLLLCGAGAVGAFALDYTVTYNANTTDASVAGIPLPQDKMHGMALALSADVPTRTNYAFLGWATTPTGARMYGPSDMFSDNADTNLYAIWARNYTVIYNPNASDAVEGLPDPDTKTEGIPLLLAGGVPNDPKRVGYDFIGWSTVRITTTTNPTTGKVKGTDWFAAGDPFTNDQMQPRTLYAIWEANRFAVTFSPNTPTGATLTAGTMPTNTYKEKNITLRLPAAAPVCSGYDFLGWATTATATEPELSPNALYTDNAPLTLYAVWVKNSCRVTFNANVPSGSTITAGSMPTAADKRRGEPLTIDKIPTLTKADYTFQGWATTATGSVVILPGGVYNVDEAVTLYAIWKGRLLTVRYDKNDETATGSMADTEDVEYGKAFTLRANAYSVNLKTFKGWATKADGPVVYTDGQSVALRPAEAEDVVTLYAVWKGQDTTALLAKIKEAEDLEKNSWKYTAETWAKLQLAVNKARTVAGDPYAGVPEGERTAARIQLEIDNAANGITKAIRELETKELIFTTKHEQSIMNWLLFIFAFGWIWMWFI